MQRRAANVPRRGRRRPARAGPPCRCCRSRCRRRPWPGKLDTRNAPYVLAMLRRATELCVAGTAQALVTAPVQKSVITQSGVRVLGAHRALARAHGRAATRDAARRARRCAWRSRRRTCRCAPSRPRSTARSSRALIRITHRDLAAAVPHRAAAAARARLEPARRRERHARHRRANHHRARRARARGRRARRRRAPSRPTRRSRPSRSRAATSSSRCITIKGCRC